MKAVLCKEFGPPENLILDDVDPPKSGPHDVVISVKAAGVNFPDVLIIQDQYQFKPPLPFTPGSEVAGVVARVGAKVTGFAPGDRVLASPGWGGFAEEVAVHQDKTMLIPDQMPFEPASAFVFTYGTSYHALKDRARLKAGENLLVLGAAGGIGLSAVEVGKAMGARVIAAASSEQKLAVARERGADEAILYPKGALDRNQQKAFSNEIKALTDGNGADVICDPVGGDYSEPALRAANWQGRFLVIGFAAGPIPKIPLNLPLLKGCQIVGVFWSSFTAREPEKNKANIRELMDWYLEGKVSPRISSTYTFDKVADALNMLAERRAKGKIVLVPG